MFSMVFTGNIGSAPEFKYSKDGSPYATFSAAISLGKGEQPLWVRVTLFGKPAEIFAASMPRTGQRVVVQADRPPKVGIYEKKQGGIGLSFDLKATWVELQGVSVVTASDSEAGRKS